MFGQRRTIPESDSLWAVNPTSFQWGWVCWGDGNKILGEKLVSIGQPLPDVTEMPDKGFPWQQEMAVDLKCISGTDAGTEVTFKTNTEGGRGEVRRLIDTVDDRLNEGKHDGKVAPIVRLEKLLPARSVREDVGAAAADCGLDAVETARHPCRSRRQRRRRLPSNHAGGVSPNADVHLKAGLLQQPRLTFRDSA